jgi:transcriptional regulator with XRE-family HTH domain
MNPNGTILNEQMCARFLLVQEASGPPKGRFAARVGLTPSQLTNIARLRNPPSHEAIERAAREFGLTTDFFYFGSRVGFREPRMADRLRDLEPN